MFGSFRMAVRVGSIARLLPLVALVLAPPLGAAEFTLNASADAFLFADEAASNYGGAGQLAVSDAGRPQGEYQSLLRFDLSAAKSSFDAELGPGQWTLQAAALRLSASNPNNVIFNPNQAGTFAVSWMQNDSWVEGTGTPTAPGTAGVTFNSLPSLLTTEDQPLGTFTFPGGNSGTAAYSLDLVEGLTLDLAAGGEVSVRLLAVPGAAVSYNFSSRSFQASANRPVLTLTAVAIPEPAALVTAAGLALIVARRRGR